MTKADAGVFRGPEVICRFVIVPPLVSAKPAFLAGKEAVRLPPAIAGPEPPPPPDSMGPEGVAGAGTSGMTRLVVVAEVPLFCPRVLDNCATWPSAKRT